MKVARLMSPRDSAALLAGAFVTSLFLAGCGGGEQVGAPAPEELPKRAKYQDLHPTTPLKRPVRVRPPSNG